MSLSSIHFEKIYVEKSFIFCPFQNHTFKEVAQVTFHFYKNSKQNSFKATCFFISKLGKRAIIYRYATTDLNVHMHDKGVEKTRGRKGHSSLSSDVQSFGF